VLSMLSWLVFGALLVGRWRRGWRGAKAVRLTLVAMALLVLAFFGSKFVLELLLQRTWLGQSGDGQRDRGQVQPRQLRDPGLAPRLHLIHEETAPPVVPIAAAADAQHHRAAR